MRDGIIFARLGLPSVALVTRNFDAEASFIALAAGMPDVPRVLLPHPVSGLSDDELQDIATSVAPTIIRRLRGEGGAE